MGYFERRFVRPSHLQVVDSLEQAASEANEAQQVVEPGREHWDHFVTEIREQPEGYRQWPKRSRLAAGVVGIAWWTDRLGRRHFRIWAGSSADDSFDFQCHPDSERRPPVWHIAPENLFSRSGPGQREWIAVCECGMAGTVQAVGWMGTCCGCCHYSRAEPPAEAPVWLSSFNDVGEPLAHLAFSPDGRLLAAAPAAGKVHLFEVGGRYQGPISFGHPETQALAFGPDGLLARVGGDRMLRFIDVRSGREVTAYPAPKATRSVTIAPDNLTLAIAGQGMLEVWGRPEPSLPWLLTHVRQGTVHGMAFDPKGDLLAASIDWHLVVLRFPERAGSPFPYWSQITHDAIAPLLFHPRDRQLVTVRDDRTRPQGVATPQRISQLFLQRTQMQCAARSLHYRFLGPAISPDAEYVAGLDGSAVMIEHVRDPQRWCRLESAPGQKLAVLAFSPDGHTLATAAADGTIKFWPWRRLIPA